MIRQLIFDENKYFNVKLEDKRGEGDERKGLKPNRRSVVMITK